jgi:hypothetical protein
MWSTDTIWFDVALVAILLAFGNALLGRFSEHEPRWRRALKIVVGLALFVGVSTTAGRGWMYGLVAVTLAAIVAVHGWWLPKHGVNGWTAEPRERYYELLGVRGAGRPDPRA